MKILVVDDERVIADSLAEILKMFGYDAVSAYSGEQAIQQALSQPFNVLLNLPSMDVRGSTQLCVVFSLDNRVSSRTMHMLLPRAWVA